MRSWSNTRAVTENNPFTAWEVIEFKLWELRELGFEERCSDCDTEVLTLNYGTPESISPLSSIGNKPCSPAVGLPFHQVTHSKPPLSEGGQPMLTGETIASGAPSTCPECKTKLKNHVRRPLLVSSSARGVSAARTPGSRATTEPSGKRRSVLSTLTASSVSRPSPFHNHWEVRNDWQ